jgi:ubiquinone/menaquinone biosynthesis C-methylase UbiE
MIKAPDNNRPESDQDSGWNSYWQSAGNANALSAIGFAELGFQKDWLGYFDNLLAVSGDARVLDVACGNGLLTQLFYRQMARQNKEFSCFALDTSETALAVLKSAIPQVNCLVGDAAKMPFEDNSFQYIISHFGIEYAGVGAFKEQIRVLAPKGEIRLVCHYKDGAIYQQCQRHLKLIESFLESKLLTFASEAFELGFAVVNQQEDKKKFLEADKNLAPVVKEVAQLLNKNRNEPACQTLGMIFTDIGHMYRELSSYEPSDVFSWFEKTSNELNAYHHRLNAMLNAALDADDILEIKSAIEVAGATIKAAEAVRSPLDNLPVAWHISAIWRDID